MSANNTKRPMSAAERCKYYENLTHIKNKVDFIKDTNTSGPQTPKSDHADDDFVIITNNTTSAAKPTKKGTTTIKVGPSDVRPNGGNAYVTKKEVGQMAKSEEGAKEKKQAEGEFVDLAEEREQSAWSSSTDSDEYE